MNDKTVDIKKRLEDVAKKSIEVLKHLKKIKEEKEKKK